MAIEFRTLDAYVNRPKEDSPIYKDQQAKKEKAKKAGVIPFSGNTPKDKIIKDKAKSDLFKYGTAIADGKITEKEMKEMPVNYRKRAREFSNQIYVAGVLNDDKPMADEITHNEILNIAEFEEYLDNN